MPGEEAVNLALGFLADLVVNTNRIVTLLEEDDGEEANPWVLRERAKHFSKIPAYLRSPEAQALLLSWEKEFGPSSQQPEILNH